MQSIQYNNKQKDSPLTIFLLSIDHTRIQDEAPWAGIKRGNPNIICFFPWRLPGLELLCW